MFYSFVITKFTSAAQFNFPRNFDLNAKRYSFVPENLVGWLVLIYFPVTPRNG